jgi:hypothetical protein
MWHHHPVALFIVHGLLVAATGQQLSLFAVSN